MSTVNMSDVPCVGLGGIVACGRHSGLQVDVARSDHLLRHMHHVSSRVIDHATTHFWRDIKWGSNQSLRLVHVAGKALG